MCQYYRQQVTGNGCETSDVEQEEPCSSEPCSPICVVGGKEYALGAVIMESECEIW